MTTFQILEDVFFENLVSPAANHKQIEARSVLKDASNGEERLLLSQKRKAADRTQGTPAFVRLDKLHRNVAADSPASRLHFGNQAVPTPVSAARHQGNQQGWQGKSLQRQLLSSLHQTATRMASPLDQRAGQQVSTPQMREDVSSPCDVSVEESMDGSSCSLNSMNNESFTSNPDTCMPATTQSAAAATASSPACHPQAPLHNDEDISFSFETLRSVPAHIDLEFVLSTVALEHGRQRSLAGITRAMVLGENEGGFAQYRKRLVYQMLRRAWFNELTDFNLQHLFPVGDAAGSAPEDFVRVLQVRW